MMAPSCRSVINILLTLSFGIKFPLTGNANGAELGTADDIDLWLGDIHLAL